MKKIILVALVLAGIFGISRAFADTEANTESMTEEEAWEENPTGVLKDQAKAMREELMTSLETDDAATDEIAVELEREELKSEIETENLIEIKPAPITLPKKSQLGR
ncbi:MAG: hypothetical protein MJA83_10635 [Gammaproteobacteria bacterium]|nr:hypothetical protein [Gammaproteobacteria bacterium]